MVGMTRAASNDRSRAAVAVRTSPSLSALEWAGPRFSAGALDGLLPPGCAHCWCLWACRSSCIASCCQAAGGSCSPAAPGPRPAAPAASALSVSAVDEVPSNPDCVDAELAGSGSNAAAAEPLAVAGATSGALPKPEPLAVASAAPPPVAPSLAGPGRDASVPALKVGVPAAADAEAAPAEVAAGAGKPVGGPGGTEAPDWRSGCDRCGAIMGAVGAGTGAGAGAAV